jgi:hypothetical protein
MITIKEFCANNRMSRSTCSRFQNQGMPYIKIRNRVWIDEDEAIAWMKQQSNLYKKGGEK